MGVGGRRGRAGVLRWGWGRGGSGGWGEGGNPEVHHEYHPKKAAQDSEIVPQDMVPEAAKNDPGFSPGFRSRIILFKKLSFQ